MQQAKVEAMSSKVGRLNNRVLQVFALVVVALVTTLVSFALVPLWFVDSPESIDPWIYWGTAEAPAYARRYFSETYYFRRWPLIGLAYVFQHLLDPFGAQAAMKGLLLFGTLLAAGVIVALVTRKWSWPILAMVMIGTSEYVLRNVGSSYHQGLGVLLLMIAAAIVIAAATVPFPRLASVFAGVVCGLMFVTYQVMLYLFPAVVIALCFSLSRNRVFSRTPHRTKQVLHVALNGGLLFLGGFLAVALVADKLVAGWMGVVWKNSISYALDMRNVGKEYAPPAADALQTFLQPQGFLAAMTLVFLGTAVLLLVQESVSPSLKSWFLFFSAVTAVYVAGKLLNLHFMDAWPWTNIHYLVVTLVGIPILAFLAARSIQLSNRQQGVAMTCVAIVWVTAASRSELWTLKEPWLLLIVAVPAITFPLFAILRQRLRASGQESAPWCRSLVAVLLALGLLAIFGLVSVSMGRWNAAGWSSAPFKTEGEARSFYSELSQDHRYITQTALQQDKRVWVLDLRPHPGWSVNASALYGMYSAFALGYPPALVNCEQFDWALDYTNSSVVILGAKSSDEAQGLLNALTTECNVDFQAEVNAEASSSRALWIDISRD